MGDLLSKPSSQNPSLNPTTSTLPSSNSSQTHESKPEMEPSLESADPPVKQLPADSGIEEDEGAAAAASKGEGGKGEEGEDEEQGECGFCLYMKGGGCRDAFIEWEKCVEEGEEKEEDIVEKCFEVTAALKKCMEAHPDYYGPLLQAEKAAEEEARRELEKEKQSQNGTDESQVASKDSDKEAGLSESQERKEST